MKTNSTYKSITLVKGIVILAAVILSTAAITEAKSPRTLVRPNDVADITVLAPVAPREADFNDIPPLYTTSLSLTALAPVTPKEATFDDTIPGSSTSHDLLRSLAPETPREADFIDTILPAPIDWLTPVAPMEALFSDAI